MLIANSSEDWIIAFPTRDIIWQIAPKYAAREVLSRMGLTGGYDVFTMADTLAGS